MIKEQSDLLFYESTGSFVAKGERVASHQGEVRLLRSNTAHEDEQ